MRGSQLDSLITIEQKEIAESEYGATGDNWTVFEKDVPAQVKDELPSQSKSETTMQEVRMATLSSRIRIRYMEGITSAMRIILHVESDRVMEIIAGPAIIGRYEWLEFMVKEYSS